MALNRTYGILSYSINKDGEKSWKIEKAEPHVCIKLKAIFSQIPIWAKSPLYFYDTPESAFNLLWFTERYPLQINLKDLARLKREKKKFINNINELEAISIPDYLPAEVSLKEGYKARSYQLQGREVFLKCKRLLIGDEVGLGKTLIGILACLEPKTLPAVVVVQTHLPKQWQDEIERFTNLIFLYIVFIGMGLAIFFFRIFPVWDPSFFGKEAPALYFLKSEY